MQITISVSQPQILAIVYCQVNNKPRTFGSHYTSFISLKCLALSLGSLKPVAEHMPQWTDFIVSQSGKIRKVPLSDQGYLLSETVCGILLYIKQRNYCRNKNNLLFILLQWASFYKTDLDFSVPLSRAYKNCAMLHYSLKSSWQEGIGRLMFCY